MAGLLIPFQTNRLLTASPRTIQAFIKRGLDLAVVVPALFLLAPVFGVLALIIKWTDRGSVFFSQERVGLNGKTFRMLKFRSMIKNADALKAQLMAQNQHGTDAVTFKMKKDPRITRVGAFMRRFSLDELPQLINILRGEMTLVGPRPAVPAEVAKYTPRQRMRLEAVPGLTCLWQVSGRAEIPFEQQAEMDIDYINRKSLLLDLWLLVMTVPAVLSARGAY